MRCVNDVFGHRSDHDHHEHSTIDASPIGTKHAPPSLNLRAQLHRVETRRSRIDLDSHSREEPVIDPPNCS